MGSQTDFQLDWDLPEYPQLPKMFTNPQAAKKRKHKEFIMTEADLDMVVKIPKAAAGVLPGAVQRITLSHADSGAVPAG
jgi:hypothetical protein